MLVFHAYAFCKDIESPSAGTRAMDTSPMDTCQASGKSTLRIGIPVHVELGSGYAVSKIHGIGCRVCGPD